MGLLDSIQRGCDDKPPRMLIYGVEGCGKSTLAAQTPRPIFIATEDGLGQIDCDKFPLARSWADVMAAISALYSEQHDYQTVMLDSLDWLERMIWDQVCQDYGAAAIEKVDGGYGRGYAHALVYWRRLIDGLAALHGERRLLIVLIAHSKIERFADPESAAYDRYSPRLHKHAAALVTEWVDAVLFATRRFRVETEAGGFNRERGVAHAIGRDGGERMLRTVGGPACVAKNRYNLPAELPLAWSAVMQGLTATSSPQLEGVADDS